MNSKRATSSPVKKPFKSVDGSQSLRALLSNANTQLDELKGAANDLSSTNIAMLFLDTQLRVRKFTPAIKDLFDLRDSDVGQDLSSLAPKFSDAELATESQKVLQRLVPLEKEIQSENGRVYMRRILPYRTNDNPIEGVIVTFIDISERKQAEDLLRENQEQSRFILDGIKEYAIMRLDPQGRIATWTQAAERIFGYSSDEIIGRDMAMLFSREECDASIPQKKLEIARASGHVSGDGWRLRRDGSPFWATGSVSALHDSRGRLCGFVKLVRDNTDHKMAEEEVRRAKNSAEAANNAKNHLLANIAQVMQAPLPDILECVAFLEESGKSDPVKFAENIGLIRQHVESQKRMLDDLADASRIAAGELHLEHSTVEVAAVAANAIKSVEPAAKAKKISIGCAINPTVGFVHTDPVRLEQIMAKLLDNAVKFTPEKGYVHLKISRRESELEIKVTDTGRGIDEKSLDSIFSRFGRPKKTAEKSEGIGLGLAITKSLVELLGGSISVHSAGYRQGSTFTVKLPLPALDPVVAVN